MRVILKECVCVVKQWHVSSGVRRINPVCPRLVLCAPKRGGLDPQRCGETVSQCMMSNYIHCMKSHSVCFAHASRGLTCSKDEVPN